MMGIFILFSLLAVVLPALADGRPDAGSSLPNPDFGSRRIPYGGSLREETRRMATFGEPLHPEDLKTKSDIERFAPNYGLKMDLIHRHSERSPYFKKFSSRYEMIHELLRLDSVRQTTRSQSPSPSPSPSPSTFAAEAPGDSRHISSFSPLSSAATLGAALYLTDLYVGTPPQRALVVVDTGSDLVWVRCNLCKNCSSDVHPTFYPHNSSSLAYVPCFSGDCLAVSPNFHCVFKPKLACKYSYSYLDNSTTSGPYIRDTVTLNSTSGKPLRAENLFIGCGTENQMGTNVSSGGVLGLGRGQNSFVTQTTPIFGGKFSYCLGDYLDPATVRSSLVFGDVISENLSLKEPVQYTPLLNGEGNYYVGIEEIRINGEKLPISRNVWEMDEYGNGGTIIDSGTSLTYFAEEAFEVIMEALRGVITYPRASTSSPQQFDLCFNTSAETELQWPQFSIGFRGGGRFTPPAENYILEIEDGVRCVGFTPSSGLSGTNIIGNLLQQNVLVQFDRRRALVGFATADCVSHNN